MAHRNPTAFKNGYLCTKWKRAVYSQTPNMNGKEQTLNLLKVGFSTLLGALLIGIAIWKARQNCLTHDEAVSYIYYIEYSYLDLLSWKRPWTNNHILNTIFMKFNESVFGSTELALRLHSIGALALTTFALSAYLKRQPIAIYVGGLIMILCHPFLFDFFSVARGYGMTIGFMTASLCCIKRYTETGNHTSLSLGFVSAILSFYSNFVMLNFIAIYVVLANLSSPFRSSTDLSLKGRFWAINRPMIIIGVILIPIAWEIFRRLAGYEMDFVALQDFWWGTIDQCSQRNLEFFESEVIRSTFSSVLKIVLLINTLIIVIANFKNGKTESLRSMAIITTSIWLFYFFSLAFNLILNSGYPEARMAQHLFVLLCLNFVLLLAWLYERIKLLAIAALLLCVAFVAVNFIPNSTTEGLADWGFNRFDKAVMKTIQADLEQNGVVCTSCLSIHTEHVFVPPMEFYRNHLGLYQIKTVVNKSDLEKAEYAYVTAKDDSIDHENWEELEVFLPPYLHVLLKRK